MGSGFCGHNRGFSRSAASGTKDQILEIEDKAAVDDALSSIFNPKSVNADAKLKKKELLRRIH
jgi:hypothetical protein